MPEPEVWTLIEPVMVYRRMGSVTGVEFNEQMLLEAGTRVVVQPPEREKGEDSMPCRNVGNAIVCSRGRRQRCSVPLCGRDSVALCDYPVERKGKKTTCDSPMCQRHRHPVPGQTDTDWCETHFHLHKEAGQEAPNQ